MHDHINPDGTEMVPNNKRYKCPKHNTWMRKFRNKGEPICELCCMERDKQQREFEKLGGKHKPPVKIGKI